MKASTIGMILSLLLVGVISAVSSAQTVREDVQAAQAQVLPDTFVQSAALPGVLPLKHVVMSTGGFGDRLNSYAWSMTDFKGDLYVGTGRYVDTFGPMWELIGGALFPGTRPPQLPDAPDVPFMQDWTTTRVNGIPVVTDETKFNAWKASSYAEIWKYSHDTRAWSRVYQAHDTPSFVLNATTHKMTYTVSSAMGFRKMDVVGNSAGDQIMYAFVGGFTLALPGANAPLILASKDGTNWVGVPTPAGMGQQTRSSAVFNGKLYVGVDHASSTVHTSVWCTDVDIDDPTNVSWEKVLDFDAKDATNSGIVSLASFNGKLYVGTQNVGGFQVWCGSGTPGIDDWQKVVSDGGVDKYNAWAGTMKVFNNYLYVGSISLPYLGGSSAFKGFDILRIDTKNKWQLMVGGGTPASPVPGYEKVRSLSGQKSGFGNQMNFYCWSMEVFRNKLYVGTFDATLFLRYLKDYTGPLPSQLQTIKALAPILVACDGGADLWETTNGTSWTNDTKTGYSHADNYGLRTMEVFDNSLILGFNNPFDGCEIHALAPSLFR